MTRVMKGLCLYKNSYPKGLSAPAPGLYTCIKTRKIMYKIRLQRYFLKLASNWQSDKAFLLTSGFCPQRVVCPCPGVIYMWKKHRAPDKMRICVFHSNLNVKNSNIFGNVRIMYAKHFPVTQLCPVSKRICFVYILMEWGLLPVFP